MIMTLCGYLAIFTDALARTETHTFKLTSCEAKDVSNTLVRHTVP